MTFEFQVFKVRPLYGGPDQFVGEVTVREGPQVLVREVSGGFELYWVARQWAQSYIYHRDAPGGVYNIRNLTDPRIVEE